MKRLLQISSFFLRRRLYVRRAALILRIFSSRWEINGPFTRAIIRLSGIAR